MFRKLRYDNLTSAVKRILRGLRRKETARFVAFRPVTEIVINSLKKLGKAEKAEGAGIPSAGSEFPEEITDADVPF